MSLYKMTSTVATSTDALQSFDVRENGVCTAVAVSVCADAAAQRNIRGELSFGSTNAIATNDTTQVIASYNMNVPIGSANISMAIPVNVQINAGERIYMHQTVSGATANLITTWHMYVDDKGGSRPPQRR